MAEFIAKKGITAKGKKCSPYDLKAVEFGEPLEKDEPEAPGEAIAEPFDGDDDMADDAVDQVQPKAPDVPSAEPSDDAPEAPEDASDSGTVDFDDWEPTLF